MDSAMYKVRAYGCFFLEQRGLLISKEEIGGQIVRKLPGGGVHPGESPWQCLQREVYEESGIAIESAHLFYTPARPVFNHFKPAEQVYPLYFYLDEASGVNWPERFKSFEDPYQGMSRKVEAEWLPLEKIDRFEFTFPSDRQAVADYFQRIRGAPL